MGFMNKLSKMKNFLFDEEEIEEKPAKRQIVKNKKKEDIKVKEEDFEKTLEIENLYMEDLQEEPVINKEVKSRTTKVESSFEFPSFNDDDFASVRKKEPVAAIVKEELKPVLYQGSKRKDETKKFKPSPIISPVYGLLDDKGKKINKDSESYDVKFKKNDDISFDEVRRKAYGENKEDTLKNLSTMTIEEAEMNMKEKEELSRAKQKIKKNKDDIKTITSVKEDDDMILPNINFKEIDVDKERLGNKSIISKKSIDIDDDDDEETKEQDLFNLIDSMYQGKESEE